MKVEVLDKAGRKVKELLLPKEVFDLPWNSDLVHQVMKSQLANQRQVLAHTKGRSEVRGGGRKPWRQKGTGRARHGSIRSPLWRGGGVTFGPTASRNFKEKINKKMNRKAILTVLSKKVKDKEVIILNNLDLDNHKTKSMMKILRSLPLSRLNTLVALPEKNENISKASQNIGKVKIMQAPNINVLDLLSYKYVILPESSVKVISEVFTKK